MSRLERGEGKQPSAMVLQRLASAFGVEVRDLTGVANDSAPARPGPGAPASAAPRVTMRRW